METETESGHGVGRRETGFPPPPRRTMQTHPHARAHVTRSEPPRRGRAATGLMDESFVEAGGIPALVPRRG